MDELEGLKAKSTDLEECCRLLNDEKYNLLNERSDLVSQLESVEEKLSNLEKMFTKLEEKYTDAEKDKETIDNQVEELCTGGEEASLFAMDIFKMYEKYAHKKGWKFKVVDIAQSDLKGYKVHISFISAH
ncbi:hypothetical protein RJT34_12883 [Clitoria ternatea]|uniref:Peptide chain release factor domain-containing protein n=1 Tax=Clitoria ternatea TaxID=43366 RepID=A0AAN9JMM8_CLITE